MNCKSVMTCAVLTVLSFTAQAQTPKSLDDLVDMRASSGERELEDRGYRHRKTIKIHDDSIGYWWNSRKERCVGVKTRDGRYSSIFEQPESMCKSDDKDNRRHHDAEDVAELRGMRAGRAEDELKDMGYRHRKSINIHESEIGYWWNKHEERCIAATVKGGRLSSVMDQPKTMCGK